MPESVPGQIEELTRQLKELRRDLYGSSEARQKGVFDRLEQLEEHLQNLKSTYELEKVEQGYFGRLEAEMDQLRLDYRIAIVYLKGIAGTLGIVVVGLVGAAIVGVIRFLGGG